MKTSAWDQGRADLFSARMAASLDAAALALMLGVGHQVGLLDTLARLGAGSSDELARAAGLSERYVREWLAAMASGGVVEHDARAGTFRLPAEHAACLTRAAGPANIANDAQVIAMLGEVEQAIVQCFRHGGGVPYSGFPRFQQLMAESSQRMFDSALLSEVLPLVPGLRGQLERGAAVLDIGCGSGHALNVLAQAFPQSRFVGYDLSPHGVAAAWGEAFGLQLSNVDFRVHDLARLGERGAYDLITAFDVIHDQAAPMAVLRGVARALRPGGVFLMADVRASSELAENIATPLATFRYTLSCMHCMTVSLAEGGAGLGMMWGEQQALQMLAEAGFSRVEVAAIAGDTFNSYYIARLG